MISGREFDQGAHQVLLGEVWYCFVSWPGQEDSGVSFIMIFKLYYMFLYAIFPRTVKIFTEMSFKS